MSARLRPWQHAALAVALLLATVSVVLSAIEPVWRTYVEQQARIVHLLDQRARYRAIAAREASVTRDLTAVRERVAASRAFVHGATTAVAAAQAQRRLTDAVTASGLQVTRVQALPVASDAPFAGITVRGQVRGDVESVRRLLYALEYTGDGLSLVALDLRATGGGGAPVLDLRFDVAAMLAPAP